MLTTMLGTGLGAMSATTGHCGITTDAGDCEAGEHGSWNSDAISVRSVEQCAAHCLAHCPRCAYVSFHAVNKDCSWYSSCAKLHFSFGGAAAVSLQVRAATSMLPPPPPPPHWSAPAHSVPGFCTLMGPDVGDCDSATSDQGSWPSAASPDDCLRRCSECRRCRFVSFTLSAAPEGEEPIGGRRNHGPFWWRCRWCRRRPTHAPPFPPPRPAAPPPSSNALRRSRPFYKPPVHLLPRYRRCALDDLRATPPTVVGYLTAPRLKRKASGGKASGGNEDAVVVAGGGSGQGRRRGAAAAASEGAAAEAGAATHGGVSVGIATLVDFDPHWRSYGGVDATCAMAQW